jgi:hypothetical protein
VLRQGPIAASLHGIIEYLAGILFVAAPFIFGYVDGWAVGVSIAVGVALLVLTAASALPTGLVRQIPVSVHLALDFIVAAFLIAAPFLFGFDWESAPLAVFLVAGVAHLLITIATRFRAPEPQGLAAGAPRGAAPAAERPPAGREAPAPPRGAPRR